MAQVSWRLSTECFPKGPCPQKGVSNDLGDLRESKQPSQKAFSLLAPVSSSAFPYILHSLSFSENDQG